MQCSSGGTEETRRYPPGGWAAPEDHEKVLRSAAAQVTAQTADAREWGGELGPPTHAPPHDTA